MFNLDNKINILEALHLLWDSNNGFVKGRNFHSLSIRIKGSGQLTHGEKTEQVAVGTVAFASTGTDYYTKTDKTEMFAIHFQTDKPLPLGIKVYTPQNFSRLVDLFSRLHLIFTSKTHGYELKSLSLFYDILYELKNNNEHCVSPNCEKIKGALDYLHANFTNPELSIKTVCEKSFFSDTYFRKLFLNLYKTTPLNYLNNLRLDHAKALLLETNHTVSYVALLSGFYDDKYFRKLFKKKFGLSPNQIRNK